MIVVVSRKRLYFASLLFAVLGSSISTNALQNNTPLVTCASSSELERAVSFFCRPGDKVLEIGAQYDSVSKKICASIHPNGKATLVDVERRPAKSGRCTHRDSQAFIAASSSSSTLLDNTIEVVQLSSLDDWKVDSRIFQQHTDDDDDFDVIVIDLGHLIGNDLHLATLTMTDEVLSMVNQPPRTVLLKSKSLASLARRLIPAQHILEGHQGMEDTNENRPLQQNPEPYVLCAVGVEEYRRLIPKTVQQGDIVLEVGCHFGRTTHLLNAEASRSSSAGGDGYCIGVDIGPKIIQSAKSQYPTIQFAVVDGRRTLELLKLRKDGLLLGYDVVYADIGGLSGAHGTFEALTLIESMGHALEPRCIVIKSLCMKRLASRLRSFTLIWAKKGMRVGSD